MFTIVYIVPLLVAMLVFIEIHDPHLDSFKENYYLIYITLFILNSITCLQFYLSERLLIIKKSCIKSLSISCYHDSHSKFERDIYIISPTKTSSLHYIFPLQIFPYRYTFHENIKKIV